MLLQPFALAYNLGNFLRRLALPRSVKHWSRTALRVKPIKIGAKVVRHVKYGTFQNGRSGGGGRVVRGHPATHQAIRGAAAVAATRLSIAIMRKIWQCRPWGWSALRRLTGQRPPRRSDMETWTGSGVEKRAFSEACLLAVGVGLSIR